MWRLDHLILVQIECLIRCGLRTRIQDGVSSILEWTSHNLYQNLEKPRTGCRVDRSMSRPVYPPEMPGVTKPEGHGTQNVAPCAHTVFRMRLQGSGTRAHEPEGGARRCVCIYEHVYMNKYIYIYIYICIYTYKYKHIYIHMLTIDIYTYKYNIHNI